MLSKSGEGRRGHSGKGVSDHTAINAHLDRRRLVGKGVICLTAMEFGDAGRPCSYATNEQQEIRLRPIDPISNYLRHLDQATGYLDPSP